MLLLALVAFTWLPASGVLQFKSKTGYHNKIYGNFYFTEEGMKTPFFTVVVKGYFRYKPTFSLDKYCAKNFRMDGGEYYEEVKGGYYIKLSYTNIYMKSSTPFKKERFFSCVLTATNRKGSASTNITVEYHPEGTKTWRDCSFLYIPNLPSFLVYHLDRDETFGGCGLVVIRQIEAPTGCGDVTVGVGVANYPNEKYNEDHENITTPTYFHRTVVVKVTGRCASGR